MSTAKSISSITTLFVLLLAALLVTAGGKTDNDVLEFYLNQAKNAYKAHHPLITGARYSFTANSLCKHTDSHGRVGKVDTLKTQYWISFGEVDSQKVIAGDEGGFGDLELFSPNIFETDYEFNTFPNYTGDREFGIGFDTRTSADPAPVGLVMIDRDGYYPLWLYLSYLNKPGYARFTRSFRFAELEGFVLPDSIWVVAARQGVFGTDNYRIETGLTDIVIQR